jgi:hypothetical protein
MKFAKPVALTATLAVAAAVMGTAALAATAAPTANDAHARCEKQAKDKHVKEAALKDYLKKCEADAAREAVREAVRK